MDSSADRYNYNYTTALSYLPSTSLWDNPALVEFDGKACRFIQLEDLYQTCGGTTTSNITFNTCQFFLETSKFQDPDKGRSGIWLENENPNASSLYRIHTNTVAVSTGSSNTARPVIEIPYNTIEGFQVRQSYTVTFDLQGGIINNSYDPVIREIYENQAVGSLPTPTREGYNFLGWFTSNDVQISASTTITADVRFYAHWEEITEDLQYVFRIPGTCTFPGSSGNITSTSNDCISTINETGEPIDYTQSPNSSKRYIDTLISLYSNENYSKDYEVGFTIESFTFSSNVNQASLFNTKLEYNTNGYNYPGLVFRKGSTTGTFDISQTSNKINTKPSISIGNNGVITDAHPVVVKIVRESGVIKYSYDGGELTTIQTLSGSYDHFNFHAWFGAAGQAAGLDATTAGATRYFTGTLSNMYIKLAPPSNVVHGVTFHGGDGATVTPSSYIEVTHGQTISTLPTASKSGYVFDGWYTAQNGSGTRLATDTIIYSDSDYYANWKKVYSITLYPDGGTISPATNPIEVVHGQTIGTLPTASKSGYVFDGWYSAPSGGTKFTGSEVITADDDYYAHWKKIYSITFYPDGGTLSPATNPIEVVHGETIGTLPTASKTGVAFDGWYDSPSGGTKFTGNEVITADDEYYAHYKAVYQITFELYDGTLSPSTNPIEVGAGETIGTLPTASKTGFIFDGWYSAPNGGGTKYTGNEPINANATYHAYYKQSYEITFELYGGTLVPSTTANPLPVAAGDTIGSLPTANKEGFVFEGWYSAENGGGTKYTGNEVINANATYHANYIEGITVTFDADGGTASFNTRTVTSGSSIGPLPTATKTGFIFDGWYIDDGTYSNPVDPYDTIVTSTMTVIAKWIDENWVAMIGNTGYNTLPLAVADVPKTGVKTTILLLKNTSTSATMLIDADQNIELDLQNYTVSNDTTSMFENSGTLHIKNGTLHTTGTEKDKACVVNNLRYAILNISGGFLHSSNTNVILNAGEITITGGRLEANSNSAIINNNQYGLLNISSGRFIATGTTKGQTIYNDKGTTNISGDAYFENVSQTGSSNGRACVHNNAGTVNIQGGTIISKANAAVKNNATMTIGVDDNVYDNTTPFLQGNNYGLETVAGKTVTVYDGIFKGKGTTPNKAISNESVLSYNTNDAELVHEFETIDTYSYDTAYLRSISTRYTITFNLNGGDSSDYGSKTITAGSAAGDLPSATKANASFLGWYTAASGGEKLLSTTVVADNITYYAHYTNSTTVCRPASTLHSSGGTDFGQIHSGSTLEPGDALDCDVNGDGTYDATNERFYYLTDSGQNAVLVYSNNISQVSNTVTPSCSATAVSYGADSTHGPTTAMEELPTTAQWTNVTLYTEPRNITNNAGASVINNYLYSGKSARLATLDEIKEATVSTLNGTANELASYSFLLENTEVYNASCNSDYWLETPNSSSGVEIINGATSNGKKIDSSTGTSNVRPVIEVPYSVIQGAIRIVEFDTLSTAMRTYFDNIDTWAAGQTDSSHSSYDTYMTNNLDTNKCVYFTGDNRENEVNYSNGWTTYCDQPNQYDTGVTGTVNVYEYNESTGTASNTIASYVTANNGKLYNMIPNKVYYWVSATDSSKNGYVRPLGERRIISIDNTYPTTQPKYKTRNVRDLGGIKVDKNGDGTIDGTIKYGKLYRGEKIWGGNGSSVQYYTKLGIDYEMDLRGDGEVKPATEDHLTRITSDPSNANNNVFEIIHYEIDYTAFNDNYYKARDAAARVMYEFVRAHNAGDDDYALFFHCRIGADRTGTLAYILEGLLGAPPEERYRDYELTVFFGLRERTRFYYEKVNGGSNAQHKFQYLKGAIRNAGNGVDEDVVTWFLKGGNTADIKVLNSQNQMETVSNVNLTNLISDFKDIMIDSY